MPATTKGFAGDRHARFLSTIVALLIVLPTAAIEDAHAADDAATITPERLVERLQAHSRDWVRAPAAGVESLQYTYTLSGETQRVELVRGISDGSWGKWTGTTLGAGVHWLIKHPELFDITIGETLPAEGDLPARLQVTATPKDEDAVISVVAGNGIGGSWAGFFSHPLNAMQIEIDADRLLPLRESTGFSEIHYSDWQEIGEERWIPRLIDVRRDEYAYLMHFAWRNDLVWLLTYAEIDRPDGRLTVATVSDVVVNDEEAIREFTAEEQRCEEMRHLIRDMLAHNRPWLAADYSGMESLSYSFHTLREDIREECTYRSDGVVVMRVAHDGQGKMGDRLDERVIALPSGESAWTQPEARFLNLRGPSEESDVRTYAESFRHYGRIGCQLDLPIFRYEELIDVATIDVEPGEWNGTPCHVATVRYPSRNVFLGCGTMLGFSSWSYVPRRRPDYEKLYLDSERNVPLRETLVSGDGTSRFEIDFTEYVEVEPGQWAPMAIRIESPGYFTCECKFQLIEGRHWLLSEVESWFEPENKSRAVVADVVVNQPSVLIDAAMQQVETTRALFETEGPAVSDTISLPAHPFAIGRRQQIQGWDCMFTVQDDALVLQCSAEKEQPNGDEIAVILLDEQNRILAAGIGATEVADGRQNAVVPLGGSTALAGGAEFIVAINGECLAENATPVEVPLLGRVDASPHDVNIPDQVDAKSRAFAVRFESGNDGRSVAQVDVVSTDGIGEIMVEVSLCLFDARGTLKWAGTTHGEIRIDQKAAVQTIEIPLGIVAEPDWRAVVAISRGQTVGGPIGSFWGRFKLVSPFQAEDLLAGDDVECWRQGMQLVVNELHVPHIIDGYLVDIDDGREHYEDRSESRRERFGPHTARLSHIAANSPQSDLVASVARMIGMAGDPQYITALRPLLDSDDPLVQDAAAVGLGMLGVDDGFERLLSMLAMTPAELAASHASIHERWAWEVDVLAAFKAIGGDEAARVVGEQLLVDLQRLPPPNGPADDEPIESGRMRVYRLWRLLGVMQRPSAVPYLIESSRWIDEHPESAAGLNLDPLLIALADYEADTHAILADRMQRVPDGSKILYFVRGPYYIDIVRQRLLTDEVDGPTFATGVRYLSEAGTDPAVQLLAELFDRRLAPEERYHLEVCAALARHGDQRGLNDVFAALVKACRSASPPEGLDERALRRWERDREDARKKPIRILDREPSATRISIVERHVAADEFATQLACLEVLESLRGPVPESLLPTVAEWSNSQVEEVALPATRLLHRNP